MPARPDDETRCFQQDFDRKQFRARPAEKIDGIMARLLAQRGYAQVQAFEEWEAAWRGAVGGKLSDHSRPGNLKRGVLEIVVRNSIVLQELTFQKAQILEKLQRALSHKVRDLRFKVGAI